MSYGFFFCFYSIPLFYPAYLVGVGHCILLDEASAFLMASLFDCGADKIFLFPAT